MFFSGWIRAVALADVLVLESKQRGMQIFALSDRYEVELASICVVQGALI